MKLYEIIEKPNGKKGLKLNLHPGQLRIWESKKRFLLALGGVQSGKTSSSPIWLYREICNRGPGDYLVGSPTFPLLQLKALPEFLKLFQDELKLGEYRQSPIPIFKFNEIGNKVCFGSPQKEKTNVFFRHASNAEGLESMTVKAAWLDEAGQPDFKESSWDAIQSRLAIHRGRCLISTTPYQLGWLKNQIYDPWNQARKAGREHPDICVSQFNSLENPMFPKEEYYREQDRLPPWKFRMRYMGEFDRPAGVIFDCFDSQDGTCDPFFIPNDWKRYVGIDFGGVNTAAVFIAEDPRSRTLYLYREYHEAQKKSIKEYVEDIQKDEPRFHSVCGGAPSEDQWRDEFSQWGKFSISRPPISDVEVGIEKLYAEFKQRNLVVFRSCHKYIDEISHYARKLNDLYEPTEEIENKNDYHLTDASRYIISDIRSGPNTWVKPDVSKIKLAPKRDWTATRRLGT